MAAPLDALLDGLIRDIPDYPKPGVVFKDITPLLGDRTAFAACVDALAEAGRDIVEGPVDKVVGIEARGFIVAAPVALALGAGFVPVRKAGKLPHETYAVSYALEYGDATLEVHRDAFLSGDRVLIVDDVLATGGTVTATCDLLERCGADVAGVAVLMALSFLPGQERLSHLPTAVLRTV